MTQEFVFDRAPFASCHASTVVETSNGSLLCAWFGGDHEGATNVAIYLSRRSGDGWTAPTVVAVGQDGAGHPVPCWNPVLFQPAKGPLMLFYRTGKAIPDWTGWMKTSTDEGVTWSTAKALPPGILGPIKNKPIELRSGRILAGSSEEKGGWTVHFEFSDDQGKSWLRTAPQNVAAEIGAIQPALLVAREGYVSAVGRTNKGKVFYLRSEDQGVHWGHMRLLDVLNPNSGVDAVALKNGKFLLVYNDSATHRTPLAVALSTDGTHWKRRLILESEAGEFSYPAVIQTRDGAVHITYTWNRRKIKHVVLRAGSLD